MAKIVYIPARPIVRHVNPLMEPAAAYPVGWDLTVVLVFVHLYSFKTKSICFIKSSFFPEYYPSQDENSPFSQLKHF